MSGSVNKVVLVGNVGKKPEIRTSQDGRRFANFTLATNESWKDKTTGEKKTKTQWHKIIVGNESTVNLLDSYVNSGDLLYIEGSLETRKWQDKLGNSHYTTEIKVNNFKHKLTILNNKSEGNRNEE